MANMIHPLKIVSLKILEDWAFMLVDEVEVSTELFDAEKPIYISWVNLHGVIDGAVSIVAQEPFLKALAANLLGETDPDGISEIDRQDAFREMGNVLAGNFLTEGYGADAVFELNNPIVREIDFKDLEKFVQRKVVFAFLADDSPVAVTFSISIRE